VGAAVEATFEEVAPGQLITSGGSSAAGAVRDVVGIEGGVVSG